MKGTDMAVRWEYQVMSVQAGALSDALRDQGIAGWELVSVQQSDPLPTLIFKRRLQKGLN